MRMRGLRTVETAARWLRSRRSGGGLVLLYHRLDENAGDPLGDPFALAVSPRRFAEHLEVLRTMATPVSLQDMSRCLERGDPPRRAVAVTFDDGYADNLHLVEPLLERYQVPATVFVVSGALGRHFWWDELSRLVLRSERLPARLTLTVGGRARTWHLRAGCDGRRRLLRRLHGLLRPLQDEKRALLMKELTAWSGIGPAPANGPRALTAEELARLAAAELVEIGAHTVTHPPLAALPAAAQRREIEHSKARLEAIVGMAVTSFSYPYGSRSDYSSETVDLVRRAGFQRACTTVIDRVGRGGDAFELPRYWVRDWTGSELERRLQRWLGR